MKTVIINASLTEEQIAYLRNLAQERGIDASFFYQIEEETPQTPITGEIIDRIAAATGKTALEVYRLAEEHSIETVQQALSIKGLPSEIASVLEEYA